MTVYQVRVFAWSGGRWRAAVNGSDGSQWEGPICDSKAGAEAAADVFVEEQKALEK